MEQKCSRFVVSFATLSQASLKLSRQRFAMTHRTDNAIGEWRMANGVSMDEPELCAYVCKL